MTSFLLAIALALDPYALAERFPCEVNRRLSVPAQDQAFYLQLINSAYGSVLTDSQYLLVVDRNPYVQAAFLLFRTGTGDTIWIGASPVSTGRPGAFEHFATPVGLFLHSTANPDYRAEGTKNKNGIRGYGLKGMRVYDFGWVKGTKGWGDGGESLLRLQVHATDPELLEPRLGVPLSKGCVRVPAEFNTFLDRYALLDADYEAAGRPFFVLRPDRKPAAWSGRYLLVLDSQRTVRPAWSSMPNSVVPRRNDCGNTMAPNDGTTETTQSWPARQHDKHPADRHQVAGLCRRVDLPAHLPLSSHAALVAATLRKRSCIGRRLVPLRSG